jgi:Tfp pilus assembly protein PilZ
MDESNVTHPDYETPPVLEPQVAFSAHVMMMEDGKFAIQTTGEPSMGDMQMILSRALSSVESRMVAETVVQLTKTSASRIITPGR